MWPFFSISLSSVLIDLDIYNCKSSGWSMSLNRLVIEMKSRSRHPRRIDILNLLIGCSVVGGCGGGGGIVNVTVYEKRYSCSNSSFLVFLGLRASLDWHLVANDLVYNTSYSDIDALLMYAQLPVLGCNSSTSIRMFDCCLTGLSVVFSFICVVLVVDFIAFDLLFNFNLSIVIRFHLVTCNLLSKGPPLRLTSIFIEFCSDFFIY